MRLSVTDRCDLACVYCMPSGGEDDHTTRPDLLTFEEATRLVSVFVRAGGRRVRLTGGEPLVRKDVLHLVELLRSETGIGEIAMTTNATRLSGLAAALARAGLDAVNVSVDTLDPDRFRRLTRGGDLAAVLAGVDAALEAGLAVKLNTVALRGENEREVGRIVDWAWERGVTPRFIELMPLGEAARLPRETRIGPRALVAALGERVQGLPPRADSARGPARYLRAADGSGRRVGFITAMSDTFCESCNRIRITARGDVRACLASRRAVSLRDRMRSGATDRDLAWSLAWALGIKEAGHSFLDEGDREHEHVGMSLVGG
jgi:cyclic pyranopterin phosphate synthase